MRSDRACTACGRALLSRDYANGTIWECRTHGVREWFFEDPRDLLLLKP